MIQSIAAKIPGVSTSSDDEIEEKSLEELPDELVARAGETLQQQDEELNPDALRKQANYLRQVKQSDPTGDKIGFIQDREENKITDQSLAAPDKLKEEASFTEMGYMKRNDKLVRILTVTNYPKYLPPGILSDLYTTHANVRVSQHIQPRDVQSVLKKLHRKLNRLWAHIARKREKGKQDTQEEEEKKDTVERLIWDIITGKTKLFDYSVYIEVIADDKRELNNHTKNIINELGSAHIDVTSVDRLQVQ
jgi:hypothetical protein